MANQIGRNYIDKLPAAVAISPLSRMIAAVVIDGRPRRFYGIQRPQPTDPTTQQNNYTYSEGQVPTSGETTPGNVALEFTHVANGLVDDFLNENKDQSITMHVYTRGGRIGVPPAAARFAIGKVSALEDYTKGLSELTPSGDGWDAAKVSEFVRSGFIREGCVIQTKHDPADFSVEGEQTKVRAHDLIVVEQPYRGADDDDGNAQYKLFTKGRAAAVDALGAATLQADTQAGRTYEIEFYDSSTLWVVTGTLVNYSPQYGQDARTARLEMTRTVETDNQIRYEAAHAMFMQ